MSATTWVLDRDGVLFEYDAPDIEIAAAALWQIGRSRYTAAGVDADGGPVAIPACVDDEEYGEMWMSRVSVERSPADVLRDRFAEVLAAMRSVRPRSGRRSTALDASLLDRLHARVRTLERRVRR